MIGVKNMKKTITIRDIVTSGLMLATLEVAKNVLAFLPNVELVTLLVILYTLFFGRKIFIVIPGFILLEGTIYGFGLWWIMYLYAWPLLAILTLLFKKQKSVWFWSILSGSFGLSFGALCAIPYIFLTGFQGAIAWWIAGIPYDILHCISNFLICTVLFVPLRNVLTKVTGKLQSGTESQNL